MNTSPSAWAEAVMDRCAPRVPVELWPYFDRQFLSYLEGGIGHGQPDAMTLDEAVRITDCGETGVMLELDGEPAWMELPWSGIEGGTMDDAVRWAVGDDVATGGERRAALEPLLRRYLEVLGVDPAAWKKTREKWTLGDLRRSIAAPERLAIEATPDWRTALAQDAARRHPVRPGARGKPPTHCLIGIVDPFYAQVALPPRAADALGEVDPAYDAALVVGSWGADTREQEWSAVEVEEPGDARQLARAITRLHQRHGRLLFGAGPKGAVQFEVAAWTDFEDEVLNALALLCPST